MIMGWISYIAIAVVISTMVYAIISSVAIKKQKKANISRIVFGIYFVLLTWLVLFKFTTSLSELPSIRGINLIPFYYDQETSTHLSEVFYNMIVFVPLGVYIQILRDKWKITTKCFIILLTSFLFEVIQFIFAIGASDITDLIGNTLGGLIGILFCIVMRKITTKKYIATINLLGGIIEVVFIGLIVLLLVANR